MTRTVGDRGRRGNTRRRRAGRGRDSDADQESDRDRSRTRRRSRESVGDGDRGGDTDRAGDRGRTRDRERTRDRDRRRGNDSDRGRRSRASARRPATERRRRPRRTAETESQPRSRERRQPTRRRYLARRGVALLVVLTVLALGYLVLFTSLLGVRSVEVVGTKEIPKQDVIAAAAIEPGTPMVRLDADEAAARVAELPRVFEVVVQRSWPSTVEIVVTERTPVAVQVRGDGAHLVDRTGVDYAVVKQRPPGLPLLVLNNVGPRDPATRAAVDVLGAIPKQLRAKVTQVSAPTPGDVRLTLADGRLVKWGNAKDSARKAAVLAPLLTRPGKVYDVTTPEFPTVS